MFDIAWSELGVIAVVALVVIGPKDLPKVLRTIGQWTSKARSMAREFQSGIDDMVREADLDELRKAAKQVSDFSIENEVKKTFDPDGSLEKQFTEHNQAIMDATSDLKGETTTTRIADPGPDAAPAEPANPVVVEAPAVETPAAATPEVDKTGTKS
ncbi:MAG: Sec-independent protein translocase protein TatB [Ferrovibrio sp.]|uniref:Sec-independent protein translocase protein TatB n=1 Tax=Ferrovibrio sp. TaxID=1917215 RepID=UPI00261B7455|nr:Sec-independent protein translocase protein TatB [Ferrovibrio sp.]MCW0236427.1 Sec-independent protein translocase protein TatB [Ferrovibrio sp.]